MFLRVLGVFAIMFLMIGMARAETTAGELLEYCTTLVDIVDDNQVTPLRMAEAQRCLGMVEGIGTTLSYNCWSRSEGYSPMLASETPSSIGLIVEAFITWVTENPHVRTEAAVDVMIGILMENFPCQR
jgi:hypothetical protein